MSSGICSSHVRETDLHAWRCVNANKNSEKRSIYPGNSWFYRRVKWESSNKISFISMITLLRDTPGFREFRSQKLNSYAQREPDGRSAELTEEEKLNLVNHHQSLVMGHILMVGGNQLYLWPMFVSLPSILLFWKKGCFHSRVGHRVPPHTKELKNIFCVWNTMCPFSF